MFIKGELDQRLLIFSILAFALTSGSVCADDKANVDYYSPENILRFADHLYQEKDYLRAAGEYRRYLIYSDQNADGILYKIGLCYRRAGDIDRAVNFFHRSMSEDAKSQFHFASSYQIAYSYLLLDRYENSIQHINQALGETQNASEYGKLRILAAYNHLHQRRWNDAEHTLNSLSVKDEKLSLTVSMLKTSAREGIGLPRRNPTLASLFSAVIPGTGKMYCRQHGDGIYSLILIGITGWLAWDGFRENGIRSVRGWLFGTASGVFYAGNVYGSAIAARIYNRQLEADLLERLPPVPDVGVNGISLR